MTQVSQEMGDIMDIRGYPTWAQEVVQECQVARDRVTGHELYRRMRENVVSPEVMRNFLVGVWPVIWAFPQYMAKSLCRVQPGVRGHADARTYLIKNIRVENKHALLWTHWAEAHDISRYELRHGRRSVAAEALSHWCADICGSAPLAVGMAATNYAIEGATGDWSCYICSSSTYAEAFPPEGRKRAMAWLTAHAEYDDKHPWEALAIIVKVLGFSPASRQIRAVKNAIERSYDYMCLTQDSCLDHVERATTRLESAA